MAGSKNIPGEKVRRAEYFAFVPAALPPKFEWTQRLVRLLSEADRLIGTLAGEGGRLPNPHVLIRPFVRREAVLSSKIVPLVPAVMTRKSRAPREKLPHGLGQIL